ncbi:uncharacterized protein B0I36DRAFT_321706 [Microdochium trichocladiopsis]|uniref:Uncharacterized protein n=1 Tax=Microdochium trichocladiopsis TaxID=1682393 RepID=A0A9P9BS82_9PEZI|nr:uncharacterized protein B0I36DRAFT_321706 [Microdochium trichocladiopsis]KAH7033580.1 hypothetical protein B0I36DRAFT_321706 [Microdochium trichocladiopsis]
MVLLSRGRKGPFVHWLSRLAAAAEVVSQSRLSVVSCFGDLAVRPAVLGLASSPPGCPWDLCVIASGLLQWGCNWFQPLPRCSIGRAS